MVNGHTPPGGPMALDAVWQVAQARDLLLRRGYVVLPNGSAKLFEMKTTFDPTAPSDMDDEQRKARHNAALTSMAHRLGVALVNNRQVEIVIAPGKNGLPDEYALKVMVVDPQAAVTLPKREK